MVCPGQTGARSRPCDEREAHSQPCFPVRRCGVSASLSPPTGLYTHSSKHIDFLSTDDHVLQ